MTETAPSATIELTYREAVKEAIRDALRRDERVFLMGEDVGRYGGCYAVTKGLLAEFGPERIRDTPLSESGFTGAGIGAAMAGMRPIVELMTVNFSLLALDQILNNAATVRHMSGNQFGAPLVIRMATGAGRQLAAQHSHSLEGWYAHIPGIKVLAPATLEDARGMLWTALQDPDPVLIFENVMLYNMTGRLAPDAGPVEIEKAAVRRVGRDISLITYGGSLWKTLEAAALLANENIDAEVIDLRTLRPLDDATMMASVQKTRRAVIVDEGWRSGSLAAEIGMRIVERAFWELDGPIGRVCSEEVPIPYPRHLEIAAIPQVPKIVSAAKAALGRTWGRAMAEFRMPSLGADMEAGTLVEWLIKPGDEVKHGDIIAVVETQKGAIEIEVFEDGQVEQLLVPLNTKVPVGTPLARIRGKFEAEVATSAQALPSVVEPPMPKPAAPEPAPLIVRPLPAPGLIRASPAARRLAQSIGLELAAIEGTGPGGAIVLADVKKCVGAPPAQIEQKRAAGLDLNVMRTAIAAAMARSKREIPHYYLQHQADVTPCEEWLARTNVDRTPSDRLLLGALAIKSVALACRRFPAFNGFYQRGGYEASSAIHAGVAIAIRGGGLAAPALRDADRLSLDELMARLRDLVQRTRAGRLRSSEISDPTITVSSLGDRGVEALYGIIYPPQVALVGFGKAVQRPWIVDGAIVPRSIITITLSADHRVSDGHAGALFLTEIGRLLQEPDKL